MPIQTVERIINAVKMTAIRRCEARKMDIKNLVNNLPSSRSADAVKQPVKGMEGNNTQPASTGNTDKVTLTNVLSQVMDLENQSKEVNVDNSAKIASLKSAIQDGSYQVNTQKIADKLIQTEALFAKV